jgi:hypothetical protein
MQFWLLLVGWASLIPFGVTTHETKLVQAYGAPRPVAVSRPELKWEVDEGWPVPPAGPNRLFYIQRSSNANTIMYDAQLRKNGQFDPQEPVSVYWLRLAEQGQRQELSWIQRTLAYGIADPERKGSNGLVTNVVSYRKRKLNLVVDPTGKPTAQIQINGRMAQLHHVFVQIRDGQGPMGISKIAHVDIFGQDPQTGKSIHERFIP